MLIYPLSSTSNLDKLGPAIAPTTTNRTIDSTPAAAAEGVNPPIAKVAKKFMNEEPRLGMEWNIRRAYKLP